MKCKNCGEVNPKACTLCRRCRHRLRPSSDNLDSLVEDAVKIGDWRLIEDKFPGKVIALHENGSIRMRLEDGRELDGWPQRTKAITNAEVESSARSEE